MPKISKSSLTTVFLIALACIVFFTGQDSGFFSRKSVYTKTESDNRYVDVVGDTMTGALTINVSGATFPLNCINSADLASNIVCDFSSSRATPTAGDEMVLRYKINDSTGISTVFMKEQVVADSVLAGSKKGSYVLSLMSNDALAEFLRCDGTNGLVKCSQGFQVVSTTKASIPMPVMTTAQRDAVASPTKGMMVMNTTTNVPNFHNGTAWNGFGATVSTTGSFRLDGAPLGNSFGAIAASGTADQLRVWQVVIPYQITVAGVGFNQLVAGGVGKTGNIGIYDSSKNLVVATSAFALDGANAVKNISLTSTVLIPGTYYLAWSVNEAASAFRFYGSVDATSFDDLWNIGESRWATAANLTSGGVMPSSLGALTNITGLGTPLPELLFRP